MSASLPKWDIHSWRIYYPDQEINSSTHSWGGAPISGVQVIVIYYDNYVVGEDADPYRIRYRKLLDGDDYYYYNRETGEFDSTNQRNQIPKQTPYLTGLEIDTATFQEIKRRAVNAYDPPPE